MELYPYFHEKSWYWGAAYSGNLEDSMHFEATCELLQNRYAAGRPPVVSPSSQELSSDRLHSTFVAGREDLAAI